MTFRYHYAIALAQSGDMYAAFPQFRQVLGEAEAHYNIGYLLYEQGQTAMAKARFEKALSINPQLQQAKELLAEIDGKTQAAQLAQAPRTSLARPGQSDPASLGRSDSAGDLSRATRPLRETRRGLAARHSARATRASSSSLSKSDHNPGRPHPDGESANGPACDFFRDAAGGGTCRFSCGGTARVPCHSAARLESQQALART